MGKILFWIAVIIVVMFAIRLINHKKTQQRRDAAAKPIDAPPAESSQAASEAMVRCEHCGIHLPRSEAVLIDNRLGCSTEHARLGPPRR